VIHLYLGNGQGKTTAAMGLALRMLNDKQRVLLVSFLKNGESGEAVWLRENSDIEHIYQEGLSKFVKDMDNNLLQETIEKQNNLLAEALKRKEQYSTIILDELTDAIDLGIITKEKAIVTIKELRESCEVVITGHSADEELVSMADYCTEFVNKKHPYEKGVKARKGIEY